jgi:hypothetical protein
MGSTLPIPISQLTLVIFQSNWGFWLSDAWIFHIYDCLVAPIDVS